MAALSCAIIGYAVTLPLVMRFGMTKAIRFVPLLATAFFALLLTVASSSTDLAGSMGAGAQLIQWLDASETNCSLGPAASSPPAWRSTQQALPSPSACTQLANYNSKQTNERAASLLGKNKDAAQNIPALTSHSRAAASFLLHPHHRSKCGKMAPINETASSSVIPVFSAKRGAQSSIIAPMVVS